MSVVRHATISPGLPAGPRDPLPGAAWREVTVLHVDVAGVTPSERIAPETVAPVMSERLTAVIAIAAAWGGIVDGCAGGCASIVFSLPHPGLQRATGTRSGSTGSERNFAKAIYHEDISHSPQLNP